MYGGAEVQRSSFLTLAVDEVSGQFKAPATSHTVPTQ
jgi:hypothetical protein